MSYRMRNYVLVGNNFTSLSRAFVVNSTDTSDGFDSYQLITEDQREGKDALPSGVVRCAGQLVRAIPIGTDAANETFNYRIHAGNVVQDGTELYLVTSLLCEGLATLGAISTHNTNELLADTVTKTAGDTAARVVAGVTDKVPASIVADTLGAEFLIFSGDRNSSSASFNMLYSFA